MWELYQIAINNPNEFQGLLQRYNLPLIEHPAEISTAIDYAINSYGSFATDLQSVQWQKNAISQAEASFKTQLDTSNVNQLKDELIRLNLKLTQANDVYSREYILDKIAYVQKLILQKTETVTPKNIFATQSPIMLLVAAIALMYVGSKILNK